MSSEQDMLLTLHEDSFYEYFQPYRHESSHNNIWGGIGLDTGSDDLELVRKLPTTHIWTVIDDADTADQWILPGIHTVNRICFLTTKVAHNGLDIQFRIPSRGNSLTKLGLLRQLNKLRKLMISKPNSNIEQLILT